jgi:uncharacterized damage-inducible protein DinB
MLADVLREIFRRDLDKLKTEMSLFRRAENVWHFEKGISNSAGNLCLHLIGNLNTYIGAVLGKTAYIRDRDAEFTLKNIPVAILVEKIEATILVVDQVLSHVTQEDLLCEYPQLVLEKKTTTEYFLVHLSAHLSYHLGQINYCRRLLDVA